MQGGKYLAMLVCAALSCLAPVRRSEAVNPETLLMPGKLSTAHQKYEEQCTLCHDRSDSKHQTRLCLDCHKDIAADITAKHGFHGRRRASNRRNVTPVIRSTWGGRATSSNSAASS